MTMEGTELYWTAVKEVQLSQTSNSAFDPSQKSRSSPGLS